MELIAENTYVLPEHWASALINGDESGMSDEEIKEMDEFLKKENPGTCVGCSDEGYFTWRNDAGTLACTVLDYTFHLYDIN